MKKIYFFIIRNLFYKIVGKQAFIFFLKKSIRNILFSYFIQLIGYKSILLRLKINGLSPIKIIEIDLTNLYILRNVSCEMIETDNANLIPFIEDLKKKKSLNIFNSFHYDLFKKISTNKITRSDDFSNLKYFRWHKSLHKLKINNRSESWIKYKILNAFKLFESLQSKNFIKYNYLNYPLVLESPLIHTRYKIPYKIKGYEIFDGHHRVACLAALKFKKIQCIVCKDISKKTAFGINLDKVKVNLLNS